MRGTTRALSWLAAEGARAVAYGGLPATVAAVLIFGPVPGLVVGCGWALLLVLIVVSRRFWSVRDASRGLVPVPLWMVLPTLGSLVGTLRLAIVSLGRIALIFGLPVGTYVAIREGHFWEVLGAFGVWFAVLVGLSIAAARNRVIVGDFEYVSMDKEKKAPAEVDVADLLRGEIARIANLQHVVGDRRAVSSGLTEQTALDATLSVDELNEAFRGSAGEQASITLGKMTIPRAPFVHLLDKVVASARINGRLHQDGDSLILTAQTTGARRIAWRVDARRDGRASAGRRSSIVRGPMGDRWLEELSTRGASATVLDDPPGIGGTDSAPRPPVVAKMVRELALRIYTDLALDESVRWEACGHFVGGRFGPAYERRRKRLSAPAHHNGSGSPVNGEVRPLERWRAAVRRVTAGHLGPS